MHHLKKNIAYNFAYQILILFLPLITAPYLSRVIGAEGVGEYTYSYTVATYFVFFVKLGLDNYGNRCIAACNHNREMRTRVFWSIYMMQVLCFICVSIAYVIYATKYAANKPAALLQGLFVLSSLLDINWFYFGMEQFGLTVLRNTIVKLITTIAIFTIVKSEEDVLTYIAIMSIGFLASQIALWTFLPKFIGLYRPTLNEIKAHIKPNVLLFISVVAVSVYNTMSKLILGIISSKSDVGIFESGARLVAVPIALISAIGTVMLPRTSSLVAEGEEIEAMKYTDLTMLGVMAFSGIAAFGIADISSAFVNWYYGPEFEESSKVLTILCITIPLLGFGNVLRTQYILPHSLDDVFVQSAICGATVSLIVNLITVHNYGPLGSAFASVSAELSVLTYQCFMVRNSFPLFKYISYSVPFIICGYIMWICLSFIELDNSIISIARHIIIGIVIYSLISYPIIRLIHKEIDNDLRKSSKA